MNSQSVRASLHLSGLVAFFATMPIYSPNIVPLFSTLTDSDLTGAFVWPFMIAVAVVSLVLSILPHSVLKGTFASHAPACVVVAYPLVTALFYLIMLGFCRLRWLSHDCWERFQACCSCHALSFSRALFRPALSRALL